jgi:hypothetical protein
LGPPFKKKQKTTTTTESPLLVFVCCGGRNCELDLHHELSLFKEGESDAHGYVVDTEGDGGSFFGLVDD